MRLSPPPRWSTAATVLVAVVLAAQLTPAAAQQGPRNDRGNDRGNVDGTLMIGDLAPDTGELSPIVQSLRVPVRLAVDEINAAGGVNDKPVGLVNGDDGSSATVVVPTTEALLANDKVDALIGPGSSPTALAIVDTIRKERVITCSGSNMSGDLSDANSGGFYFRTSPPDRLQARALAELVLSDGHKKVALLTRNDEYGTSFRKQLRSLLEEGGAKVVAQQSFDPEGTRFDRAARQVARKKPKAIVVIAFEADGAQILQSMNEANIGPSKVAVYTTDGMQSSKLPSLVNVFDLSWAAGIKGTAPAAAPAAIESPFHGAFATTGTDALFSAYYYDCTMLVALAAEKAKSDDPVKMRKAFVQNLRGKRSCNTFARCKQLLDDKKTIHWRGASSRFQKFGRTEPDQGVYDVWSYDAAGNVQIEPSSSQIVVG